MTIEQINEIKEKLKHNVIMRTENRDKEIRRVVVGMATCGIAAGARDVIHTLAQEIFDNNVPHVMLSQTGCMGMCKLEPMVEVVTKDGTTTYVKVTPDKAKRIVKEHLIGGKVVEDYTIAKYNA